MKRRIAVILTLALIIGVFAGCAGKTVVYYSECDCPDGAHSQGGTAFVPTEGALKLGLAIVGSAGDSENAVKAKYDVTVAAVLVDDNGVIQDCIIDSVGTEIAFDAAGVITSDLTADILTKTELGDAYGLKAYADSKYEWYEQAEALANFAVGKTAAELRSGAVDETGRAPQGTDLATTATIYLGGYVSAIEKAAANAQYVGTQSGDELKIAVISSAGSSKSADGETAGTAQLDCDVAAVTEKDGVITGCVIDSLQAKVSFDSKGTITSDTSAFKTKNELGADYGMVAWGGAKYEWYEQAASFAKYVTGKTAAEVAGIAVTDGKASDADLASSVTISIGGFQALIAKAMA